MSHLEEEICLDDPLHIQRLIGSAIFRMRHTGTCLPINVRALNDNSLNLLEKHGCVKFCQWEPSPPPREQDCESLTFKTTAFDSVLPIADMKASQNRNIIIDLDSELQHIKTQAAYQNKQLSAKDKQTGEHSRGGSTAKIKNMNQELPINKVYDRAKEHGYETTLLDTSQRSSTTNSQESRGEQHECLWWLPVDHYLGTTLDIGTLLVILLSVASFAAESLPTFRFKESGEERTDYHPTFFVIESSCIAWFTVEYIMRLIAAENRLRVWMWQPLNIVDLIAIVPYYISLGLRNSSISSLAIIRVLRLLRVARLFKLARHSVGLKVSLLCISVQVKYKFVNVIALM